MELFWNGVDGRVNRESDSWLIDTRPNLPFEFTDVYYAPHSKFSFKLLEGERLELIDSEIAAILQFLMAASKPGKTLNESIKEKLASLAAFRYDKETQGITIGESKILTDRLSQSQLNSAYNGLKDGFTPSISWKSADGQFVQITFADIQLIAAAVFSHVQNCFMNEENHATAIKALTSVDAVTAYDFTSGW